MREAMSHEEFENYLTLLTRTLQLRSGQDEAIAEELRLHLEERLDELTDRGVDPKKAVNIALGEFGDATALANKFTEISRMKRRRVMMRSMVGGLCVAAAILATVMTVWPQGESNLMGIAHAEMAAKEAGDNPVDLTQADRDNQETREKLKKKIDADFMERPLNEFLIEMGEQVGVQFYLDAKSIETIGLSADSPITFQLKKVPAELVLRLVFAQLDLAYFVDSGIVIVTTQEELQQNLSVKMYDAKQLIGEGSCTMPVPMQQQGMMGGMPGMAMGMVSQSDINGHTLSSMIQEVVAPEAWNTRGGAGTLSLYRGILIVRQTESVHEEIGKLLDQLREKLRQSSSQTLDVPQPQPQPGMGMGGGMPGMGGMPGGGGMMGGGIGMGGAAPKSQPQPGMGMGGGMMGGGMAAPVKPNSASPEKVQ